MLMSKENILVRINFEKHQQKVKKRKILGLFYWQFFKRAESEVFYESY